MKTILSLLTISTLSVSLGSGISGFLNNNGITIKNLNSAEDNPKIIKIDNLDLDISSISAFDESVWVSSRDDKPYSHMGLYSTTDNKNFIKNELNTEMTSIVSTVNGMLYLADADTLYKSTNGITFNRVDNFQGAADYIAITSDDVIYVASRNFLYQSTDGITFNKIYDFDSLNVSKIIISPNNTIYVRIGDGINQYVAKSFDGGYHFMQVPNLDYVKDIAVTQDNKVYISSASLYQSTDNGNNFTEIPNSRKIISTITVSSKNVVYFESTDTLWKLNYDNTISKIWSFHEFINIVSAAPDGIIWIGTNHGLFKLWFT